MAKKGVFLDEKRSKSVAFRGFLVGFEPKTRVFDGFLRLKDGILGLIPT